MPPRVRTKRASDRQWRSAVVAVDLLDELLESDVDGADVLEACVCATAQLLVELDPHEPPESLQDKVQSLLSAVPSKARWLLLATLREAPDHDPAATDLRPWLPADSTDPDKAAAKAGRRGTLTSGIACLELLSSVVGAGIGVPPEDLLALVLPAALVEHELLLPPLDEGAPA